MKKTKKITMMMLTAATMLLAACSSDDAQQQAVRSESGWGEYVIITAGMPGDAASATGGSRRVMINTDNPVKSLWEAGDQLTVWTGTTCTTENMSEHGFTLTSGAGEGTAKFSGRIKSPTMPTSSTKLIAVIDNGSDAINASAGNSVTANLATQVGATATSALDYELYYATSTNGVRNFTFAHKMALIGWTIKVNGVSDGDQCDIVLSGTGLKNSATLDPATGVLTPGTTDGTITLKDVTLTTAASTTLFVVLPPCTVSSGITATLTMTSGSKSGQSVEGSLGSGSITVKGNNYYTAANEFAPEFTPQAVDLDLPSGTLWASCNVGATSPEEYGDYFAWGETEPYYSSLNPLTWKTDKAGGYTWANYFDTPSGYTSGTPSTFTTYNTKGAKLQSQHDAATANWGSPWRMPTKAEFEELFANYPYAGFHGSGTKGVSRRVLNYNGTGVAGVGFFKDGDTNETNCLLFLPLPGYRTGTSVDGYEGYNGNLSGDGYYWSSELISSKNNKAWILGCGAGQSIWERDRYLGLSVRPVRAQ